MDIVLTWPKKRSLESYLEELGKAHNQDEVINFRVASLPDTAMGDRCYMVHDGAIRGWNLVVGAVPRGVRLVTDPVTGEYWPEGNYVVRDPLWHELIQQPEIKGFRGYRYLKNLDIEVTL